MKLFHRSKCYPKNPIEKGLNMAFCFLKAGLHIFAIVFVRCTSKMRLFIYNNRSIINVKKIGDCISDGQRTRYCYQLNRCYYPQVTTKNCDN